MSLRSRARRLQEATGLSYQQALEKIRAHAAEAAEMARERGWPLSRADLVLAGAAPPPASDPIEVVELPPPPVDPITELLAGLAATSNARSVLLIDAAGRPIAHVGPLGLAASLWCAFAVRRSDGGFAPIEPVAVAADGDRSVFAQPVDGGRASLAVVFDESSSLGLVRLRVREIVDELDRLLAARRRLPGIPPASPPSGPGGDPAEAWLSVAARRKRDRS